jgi:uncharacterized protein YuzE
VSVSVEASYTTIRVGQVARTVEIDPGCLVDIDPDGRVLGVEIIGPRSLVEVVPAILARVRFP